jgi:NAD(P)-dependent dehydrogenase (short-subunit alcohol dehydrogenase family)
VINTAGSLFRVTGDTFRPMLVTLVVNVINVGGNALLIFAFQLGTAGAAISTTFVRILAAVILVWMMQKKMIPLYLEKPWRYRPEFSTIKKILAIGVPNGIEDGMFQFGRVLTQSLISAMGTVVIAGNSVALQLANFQYMAGGAFSAVIITVVGRCIGSGDRAQAKAYSRLLLLLAYFSVGGVAIFTAVFSQPLVNFFSLSPDGFKFVFDLNVTAAFLTTQVFAIDMAKSGKGGNIINISSMNAYTPLTKIPAYSGAKAAISNFTQWLAVHFSRVGIRVNAIAPGFFSTKQNAKLLFNDDGTPTARTGKILAATPMGRFGESEELEGGLLFLVNEQAAGFITGVVLPIDGGFSAYSGV